MKPEFESLKSLVPEFLEIGQRTVDFLEILGIPESGLKILKFLKSDRKSPRS